MITAAIWCTVLGLSLLPKEIDFSSTVGRFLLGLAAYFLTMVVNR